MNCTDARRLWHRAHDDDQPDHAVSAHLASCSACREYTAQMHELMDALGALADESDRGFTASKNLRPRRVAPHIAVSRRGGLAAAAAIALLVVGLSYWHQPAMTTHVSPPMAVAPSPESFGVTLRGKSADRQVVMCAAITDNVRVFRVYSRPGAVVPDSRTR